jgi:hypothetical protein
MPPFGLLLPRFPESIDNERPEGASSSFSYDRHASLLAFIHFSGEGSRRQVAENLMHSVFVGNAA